LRQIGADQTDLTGQLTRGYGIANRKWETDIEVKPCQTFESLEKIKTFLKCLSRVLVPLDNLYNFAALAMTWEGITKATSLLQMILGVEHSGDNGDL
jgi:hypothetical protein